MRWIYTMKIKIPNVIEIPDNVKKLLEEAEKSIGEYRLPLAIFSDPELNRIEQIKLFGRVWNFLAHENEIPNPGDYVRRYIGNTQIIVVRGEDVGN
jgi:phthalate 3,4-dioxygenase alpha subunit